MTLGQTQEQHRSCAPVPRTAHFGLKAASFGATQGQEPSQGSMSVLKTAHLARSPGRGPGLLKTASVVFTQGQEHRQGSRSVCTQNNSFLPENSFFFLGGGPHRAICLRTASFGSRQGQEPRRVQVCTKSSSFLLEKRFLCVHAGPGAQPGVQLCTTSSSFLFPSGFFRVHTKPQAQPGVQVYTNKKNSSLLLEDSFF